MAQTSLLIDYGNGASKHFVNLAWKDGTTLADVLGAAGALTPGFAIEDLVTRNGSTRLKGVDGLREGGTASWAIWIGRRELGDVLLPPDGADPADRIVGDGDEVALRYTA